VWILAAAGRTGLRAQYHHDDAFEYPIFPGVPAGVRRTESLEPATAAHASPLQCISMTLCTRRIRLARLARCGRTAQLRSMSAFAARLSRCEPQSFPERAYIADRPQLILSGPRVQPRSVATRSRAFPRVIAVRSPSVDCGLPSKVGLCFNVVSPRKPRLRRESDHGRQEGRPKPRWLTAGRVTPGLGHAPPCWHGWPAGRDLDRTLRHRKIACNAPLTTRSEFQPRCLCLWVT
jgi:hypothetical protein